MRDRRFQFVADVAVDLIVVDRPQRDRGRLRPVNPELDCPGLLARRRRDITTSSGCGPLSSRSAADRRCLSTAAGAIETGTSQRCAESSPTSGPNAPAR